MQLRLPETGAPRVLSVTELTVLIRSTLEAEFGWVWVGGEVSNVRRPPSGHLYFTLKDEESQLAAVMFRSAVRTLPFELEDGMEVVARGRLGMYAPRGSLQLYVEEIDARGLGALQLAFEQRKARLAAEGLFDPARKRPLPFLPRRVGVVTALGGAAIRDILVTLRRRQPSVDVRIAPVRVQGTGAAAEIATAIADLNDVGGVDVIIVGRGGGSIEDLWAFNEEVVARAVAASGIPIVSAVGHETDFTIADFVADARAPTPTAAAQLVVPDRVELNRRVASRLGALRSALLRQTAHARLRLQGYARRLGDPRQRVQERRVELDHLWWRASRAMAERVRVARHDLRHLVAQLEHAAPQRRLERLRDRVQAAQRALTVSLRTALERRRARVGSSAAQLESLSPLAVLARGYGLVWHEKSGRLIRDAGVLSLGDRVRMRFSEGGAWARVDEVLTECEDGEDGSA